MTRQEKANFNVPMPEDIDFRKDYVYDTNDVHPTELFTPYPFNRGGHNMKSHIIALAKAIVADGGYQNFDHILVNSDTLEIIDGNCRFAAICYIMENGLLPNVSYTVMYRKCDGQNEMHRLVRNVNSGQQGWSLRCYVDHFNMIGTESHVKLVDFCRSEDILHKADGSPIPTYAAACIGVDRNKLKLETLVVTDEMIETGRQRLHESLELLGKLGVEDVGAAGGWVEGFMRGWSIFRREHKNIDLDKYFRKFDSVSKSKKKSSSIPHGTARAGSWADFFRIVMSYYVK